MRETLTEKLYSRIASDIRSGRLAAGTKLPSLRKESEESGMSINTVIGAYNLLLSEGYVTAREKSGFYVAEFESLIPQTPVQKRTMEEEKQETTKEDFTDLSSNLVDSSLFPFSTLRQLYKEALSARNIHILDQSGPFTGEEDLRQAIASYLMEHKEISCSPRQVVIGNGTTFHLQLLPSLLSCRPVFLMEKPGFDSTRDIIRDTGCKIIDIPVDNEGASISHIRESTEHIKDKPVFLHVSPSHQFPLGTTMTAPRRASIIEWASMRDQRYIIEDDYDSEFRYNGRPIAPLCNMEKNGKVIYLGTFSRTLTPSLRISYMILPPDLVDIYMDKFSRYPCPVSRIDQKAVALFISGGYFSRHISRMRRIYKSRRSEMIRLILEAFPSAQIRGEEAGLHFIMRCPTDERSFIERARQSGLRIQGTGTGWLIIGYAHLSEDEMQRFASFLRHIEQ
ncbi:MAG: PLP-dependent aminotransferase family protein [Spirochaetales bacterium]|nr:PLP-dependent aminotransferase family protein [Spirochaetales bacterium]